jgi:hypothetical protein
VGIKTAVTVMANADLFATGGRPLNYKWNYLEVMYVQSLNCQILYGDLKLTNKYFRGKLNPIFDEI